VFTQDLITGTLVNYYATCKREAWLYAHKIYPDEYDDNILMGRTLAELKEAKLQDFPFSHLKFDRIEKQRGHYRITEHKKTLKNPEAAKMQLLFYMYVLKEGLKLKVISGKVVSSKKAFAVEGTESNFALMEQTLEAICTLVNTPAPPPFEYKKICDGCAYRTYCM
jgi:CRISPR-associated exonuclease Cas4